MPEDVQFVEHHQHPTGGTVSGCRLDSPMADLYVSAANANDLGRSYACALTAEEYRRARDSE